MTTGRDSSRCRYHGNIRKSQLALDSECVIIELDHLEVCIYDYSGWANVIERQYSGIQIR